MEFVQGTDRMQTALFPESIEDFITDENHVRVIDTYVNSLDLRALGFVRHIPNDTGRPSYDPKCLLKLWIYGYMNRIRTTRRLEAEAGRNIEVMWLLERLTPDHNTLWRFRNENPKALKAVFRDFVRLCCSFGLYGADVVAVDGSKFKAVNARARNYNKQKLEELMGRIDENIDKYFAMLDKADAEDDDKGVAGLSAEQIKAILEELASRKEKYAGYLDELEETGQRQMSLTDPDSRLMMANGKLEVGYNVQTAVDAKNNLIAEFEVTNNPIDKNLLSPMVQAAAEILGSEHLDALADTGYQSASDIAQCIRDGHTPHVPGDDYDICIPAEDGRGEKIESHTNGKSVYIPERNIAICPMGQVLYPRSHNKKNRRARFNNLKACKGCTCKCTKAESYTFEREMRKEDFSTDYDDTGLEVRKVQVRRDKELFRRRKAMVEHPFGTVKRGMQSDFCVTKGLESVNGEFSLLFFSYNLKRVMNILGVKGLLAAIAA